MLCEERLKATVFSNHIGVKHENREVVRGLGAKALLLTAPVGSMLDTMLSRSRRHRHSNNVYVEVLA